MREVTTSTYRSKLVSPAVYGGTTPEFEKKQNRTDKCMVPIPTWKARTDFPCHEMTALEIHSIVASSKYSNLAVNLSKIKHQRTRDRSRSL